MNQPMEEVAVRKVSQFLADFRAFAVKGNMIDLAVGVIIGAAFGKIVDSLVKDIVMPIINFMVGGQVDFSNKFMVLSIPPGYTGPMTYTELAKAGANLFAWGNFTTILINFILLALIIFVMVKILGGARRKLDAAPAAMTPDVQVLTEIRDLLKGQRE